MARQKAKIQRYAGWEGDSSKFGGDEADGRFGSQQLDVGACSTHDSICKHAKRAWEAQLTLNKWVRYDLN